MMVDLYQLLGGVGTIFLYTLIGVACFCAIESDNGWAKLVASAFWPLLAVFRVSLKSFQWLMKDVGQ